MTSSIWNSVTKYCSLFNWKMVVEQSILLFSNMVKQIEWTFTIFAYAECPVRVRVRQSAALSCLWAQKFCPKWPNAQIEHFSLTQLFYHTKILFLLHCQGFKSFRRLARLHVLLHMARSGRQNFSPTPWPRARPAQKSPPKLCSNVTRFSPSTATQRQLVPVAQTAHSDREPRPAGQLHVPRGVPGRAGPPPRLHARLPATRQASPLICRPEHWSPHQSPSPFVGSPNYLSRDLRTRGWDFRRGHCQFPCKACSRPICHHSGLPSGELCTTRKFEIIFKTLWFFKFSVELFWTDDPEVLFPG